MMFLAAAVDEPIERSRHDAQGAETPKQRGFLDFGDADSVEQIATTPLGKQEPRAGDQQALAARVAVEPLQQSTKYLHPYFVKAGTLQKNARMHVAGNFHAASPSRSKPLSWHTDIRRSARESLDRFMSTRREQLFCPPKLVSRSFPGNYGRIKHGTSSSIANKCCKRHTVSAAAPKFFAFVVIRCV